MVVKRMIWNTYLLGTVKVLRWWLCGGLGRRKVWLVMRVKERNEGEKSSCPDRTVPRVRGFW